MTAPEWRRKSAVTLRAAPEWLRKPAVWALIIAAGLLDASLPGNPTGIALVFALALGLANVLFVICLIFFGMSWLGRSRPRRAVANWSLRSAAPLIACLAVLAIIGLSAARFA